MAIDKAISYRQQAAFGGIMGRDGRRMYGGGSDMGSVADSQGNVGPGTGGYQGGPQGGYGDAGSSNNPSGDRYRSSRREYQQAVNNAAAIEAAKKAKRDAKNKNITKFGYAKPKSKIGGILGTIAGMLMGIPGLGLLTGGLGKIGEGLGSLNETLGDFREKTTGFRTQKEYDDARRDRQLQGRLDDMYAAKSKGKGFSQKNIDMIEAMGFSPSTAQNVLTGRDLKGFTPSRMGLQTITPMSKPTFSDPFANTVGTTTKVNAPSNDAVSSYSYGTAGASIPNPNLAPTPVENVIQDAYSGIKNIGTKGNNFLDSLYNADLINQLGYQAFKNYPSDSATGPLSDARHMAAMNELSKSLSPFDNKFGSFIGDTAATALGALNELPDFFRGANPAMLAAGIATNNPVTMRAGLDDKAVAAGMEDLSANYAGTYGTPNTTSAQQIYDQVFNTNKFASGFAEGGIASLSNRRG